MGGKLSYGYPDKGDFVGSLEHCKAFFKLAPGKFKIARVKTIIKQIEKLKK